MPLRVRRVVTGHDAGGRAVFVQDALVDATPIPGLGEMAFLWSADQPATYPDSGTDPAAPDIFPPLGGVRFLAASYAPGVVAPEPIPEMDIENGDPPGMHRTNSQDFAVILSGQVELVHGDGSHVLLSAGDVVVQNGTRHLWRVVGDGPATMAAFIVGAGHR
jgi:hypothetical protein